MNPDRIVNTSTVCLFTLKAMFWALPGVNLSSGGVAVSVIFGLGFYMGMITLADAFTGQKNIRVIRSYLGLQRIDRADRFSYLLAVAGGCFWTLFGGFLALFAF